MARRQKPFVHTGCDDECVVTLGVGGAVGTLDGDLPRHGVDARQRAVHGAHPVESAESVETDPVIPGPVVGAAESDAKFLTTDQGRLGRDADDVGVGCQSHRGEEPAVTESGDDDPARHDTRFGGRGTKRDTRSSTS